MTQFDKRNISMMMDLYEMTMANGYFANQQKTQKVVFDVFYRKNPDQGGYAVFAGLEQVVEYAENLHFDSADIDYFRSLNLFSEEFLQYLKEFRFTGDIYAFPEGTVMYPNEPVITVVAPLIDAQLIETAILTQVNHQSLIATKTSRIVRAAQGRIVSDFGARRAHNIDAAVYGARAAYIGGASGTATVMAGQKFRIPVNGTMAHSWVMYFKDEYEAFRRYAEIYPDNVVLLVDTYDVLHSGVPNAIRVAKEVLEPMNRRLKGVRLDSGDLASLKKSGKCWTKQGICKKYLKNQSDLYMNLSLAAKKKRTYDRSNPTYKWVALAIVIMGAAAFVYGIYALTTHAGFGMYFLLFGLAAIFLFAGANVLPTSKNNRKYIENQLSGAIEQMEEYIRKYPMFLVMDYV